MSTLSLRLPDYLHESVRELAKQEGISINQFITLAVAEKMSALIIEDYLEQRAKRESWAKYERVLARALDVEPEEYGRLD